METRQLIRADKAVAAVKTPVQQHMIDGVLYFLASLFYRRDLWSLGVRSTTIPLHVLYNAW